MSKCLKCFRPEITCVCEDVVKIQTNTRFVILTHPKEFKKTKNGSGRMTHLSLPNSEIIVDVNFTENKRLKEIIKHYDTYILYPGKEAFNTSEKKFINTKPTAILIIDATWPCAKTMMRESKNLHSLPRISFNVDRKSKFLIKQQPDDYCLSTIEATQILLENLNNGQEMIKTKLLEDFLNPFHKMIQFQINCANDPNLKGYRKKPYTLPSERIKKQKKHHVLFLGN